MTQQHSETKKNDFVEIKYTGYANNEVFDSNIEEDLKKLNPKVKPQELIVVIGQGMVIKGFDKELENKNFGKEYEITLSSSEAFGQRDRSLMKTIPLSAFAQQKMNPRPGMVLALDNHVVKIIAVSGARVIVDFNNPLAGKEIRYKFKIIKKVEEEKEKTEALFKFFFGIIPDYDLKDRIIIKAQKNIEPLIKIYKEKFKELLGKELVFEEQEEKKRDKEENHEHIENLHEHQEHKH